MDIFVIGQRTFGSSVAKMIHEGDHQLVGACSPPWKGKSRDRDPLRSFVEDLGLPWIAADRLEAASVPKCDLIVLAHAHVFVPAEVRERARHGAIGYHPSLLPLHRGRDAIRWSVHMGERVTGGTVYWVDDGADTGPIAAQRHVFIRPEDNASSLWSRELFRLGLELLEDVLAEIAAGTARRVPQDESLATWEPSWRRPSLREASHEGVV